MPSIKTSISLDEDLHWRFQEEIPKRRMPGKDAITQALELWLAAGKDAGDLLGLLRDEESALREPLMTLVDRWRKSQEERPREESGKKTTVPRAVNQR